ncbi:UxaA family hydrolase [Monashia sp. NPDC004114]
MAQHFLVHQSGDSVGVAVTDIEPGTDASGRYQDDDARVQLIVTERVPLGHKIALADIAEGDRIIEYGVPIGRATQATVTGQLVHVHNLKGERWQ